jgi:molybdopterin molybdotransferase
VISEQEARKRIIEAVQPLPPRRVSVSQALDCFAAEDYFATVPLPAFDNSAMDGYAVVAGSCEKGGRLRVTGEQPAGPDKQLRVLPGQAVRIFTGAPIPHGADAIIMQEDVTRAGDEIIVNTDVETGEFVRQLGCDLAEGQRILMKGSRIGAATIGLLASQGFVDVAIGGEAKASVLSTGDELVKPGEKLQRGQIFESNSAFLAALLQRCGATVNLVERSRDERESLTEAIKSGMTNQVLVISGGVSVGEHDLVKHALHDLGAQIDIWRVAIKPGKPFLFGKLGQCLIFGLPGNPVSAFVTFLQFVRPAILKMMGAAHPDLPRLPARLTVNITNGGDRAHYFRGSLQDGNFTPVGRQESHALFGLSRSNALLRVEPGQTLKAAELVDVHIWE